MSHRASDAVQITYESSCLTNEPPKQTNRCDKVKKGSLIEFNITIAVIFLINNKIMCCTTQFSNL